MYRHPELANDRASLPLATVHIDSGPLDPGGRAAFLRTMALVAMGHYTFRGINREYQEYASHLLGALTGR